MTKWSSWNRGKDESTPGWTSQEKLTLQGEDQEARESGVLPSTDQISFLQLQVNLVLLVQVEQHPVGGSFTGDILVPSEGRDHWLPIQHQIHLQESPWEALMNCKAPRATPEHHPRCKDPVLSAVGIFKLINDICLVARGCSWAGVAACLASPQMVALCLSQGLVTQEEKKIKIIYIFSRNLGTQSCYTRYQRHHSGLGAYTAPGTECVSLSILMAAQFWSLEQIFSFINWPHFFYQTLLQTSSALLWEQHLSLKMGERADPGSFHFSHEKLSALLFFPFQAALKQAQGGSYGMLTHIHGAGLACGPIHFSGSHHNKSMLSRSQGSTGWGLSEIHLSGKSSESGVSREAAAVWWCFMALTDVVGAEESLQVI